MKKCKICKNPVEYRYYKGIKVLFDIKCPLCGKVDCKYLGTHSCVNIN